MACFLVPGAEAIVVSLLMKILGRERVEKLRLGILSTMLWGGTILLAVEHIWHGEVVPWPPFLTAMTTPEDTAIMLHEMATAGMMMALVVTVAWVAMLVAANSIQHRMPECEGA